MEENNIYTWAILDENTTSINDYILWWDSDLSSKIDNLPQNKFEIKEYNQWAEYESRNFCTIYSAMWMLSDLKGIKFTNEQILEVWRLWVANWWLDPDVWWYLYKAIDEVRNWWNKNNPNDKIISFRLKVTDPEFQELMDLWYSCQIWYKTSTELYNDSQDDWIVEWNNFPKKWWHAVRSRIWKIKIVDNYFWKKKYNQYTIKQVQSLIDNWIIFNEAYVFLNYNNMAIPWITDLPENSPFAEAMTKMYNKGAIKGFWDWTVRPNQSLTRWEFSLILNRLWLLD